jgi:hypothetical protein
MDWKGGTAMTTTIGRHPWLPTSIRWIARTISTLAALAWLLIFLDILACEALFGSICFFGEFALLGGMVTVSILSVFTAWRRERAGGLLMILWGLVFAAIAYLTSRPYEVASVLGTGVPFLVAGCLFLLSWRLKQPETSNGPAQSAERGARF